MRNYRRVNLDAFSDPKARKEVGIMDQHLRQLTAVMSNLVGPGIRPGPNIGGDDRIPGRTNPLDDYFFLPGRAAGQVAYGDQNDSGILTLSSTRSSTKGTIYLGSARTSVYDEYNDRVGIGTASPSAKLHVKGEPAASVFWRPALSLSGTGFNAIGTGGFPTVCAEVTADNDTSYIVTAAANPNQTTALYFNGVNGSTQTFPTGTSGWVVRFTARKVTGTAVSYDWTINDQSGTLVTNGTVVNGDPGASGTYETVEIPLSAAQATQLIGASNTSFQLVFNNFSGLGAFSVTNQVRITQFELEVPSSAGAAGGGANTALFDVDALQVVDNSQWRSSAGTVYLSVTAAGRLTIESGGSMRIVPNAGANRLWTSDASGDMTLVAVSGDLTLASGVWTIANNAVTFAKMADIATARIVGRVTAGTGDPEALTGTQATTLLDVFTAALKGLAPASGGGTSNYLRADGTWAAPPGTAPTEVENIWIYGDGSDGDFNLDGTNTYASIMTKSGNDYFLLRDLYANDLTIATGCTLSNDGWRIFVNGTLTNSGTIRRLSYAGGNGANAAAAGTPAGGTAGSAIVSDGSYPLGGSTAGTAGRNGGVGAGASGLGSGASVGEGGSGGGGGRGENGSGGNAGGAATSGTTVVTRKWRTLGTIIALNFLTLIEGGTGGRGGSSGAGDGVSRGAGGGGGGGGGGVLGIWARYIINTSGVIHADGGAGGNGGNTDGNGGAGGGGGGGGGGFVYMVYDTLSSGTERAAGGAAGLVGTQGTGGTAGTDGTAGSAGNVVKYCRLTGVFS